jgi:hypothetical protein
MEPPNPMELPQHSDEMPDLNLDFSNFDLSQFVAPGTTTSSQMHMHPLSGPHSTHTSPILNPIQDHATGCCPPQMVSNADIARLQHHLEQQRRLNELNQLQTRILQQQVGSIIHALLAFESTIILPSSRLWDANPPPRMCKSGTRA